jgi:hypothetical protein
MGSIWDWWGYTEYEDRFELQLPSGRRVFLKKDGWNAQMIHDYVLIRKQRESDQSADLPWCQGHD